MATRARLLAHATAARALALAMTIGAFGTGCVTTTAGPPPCACNAPPPPPQQQQISGGGHVSPPD